MILAKQGLLDLRVQMVNKDILVPLEYQADQESKEPLVRQVELVQLVALAELETEVKKDHAVILVVPLWAFRAPGMKQA